MKLLPALITAILFTFPSIDVAHTDLPLTPFPHTSVGIFTESLGNFYPRSINVPLVILLSNPTLHPPEIVEQDMYLSYCPKPPEKLVVDRKNNQSACYSINSSGKRSEVPKHYCTYCASYTASVTAIVENLNPHRESVNRDELRPKWQALLPTVATALGSALAWLQTNLGINGLDKKIEYITDIVNSVGASFVGLQENVIAVINATQSLHRDVVVISESLMHQRDVAQNFSRIDRTLSAIQKEAREAQEYTIRLNHWRTFHMRYLLAKQKHEVYTNAAVKAMHGGPPDISIMDNDDLWAKLEAIKFNLTAHLNYKCSFGDNVHEAFASAIVQHVTYDQDGNFAIVMSIRAYYLEKYDLLALYSYPFPVIAEDQSIVAFKKVELSLTHVAIINDPEQPNMYTIPGRLEKMSAGRWTDTRPDSRLLYRESPTCETAVAFRDEENMALCLPQAKAVHNVRPRYVVSDRHWYFPRFMKKLIELCGDQRTVIDIKPLTIVQPKCGCIYFEKGDMAFYNDRDACDHSIISVTASKYATRTLPSSELAVALDMLMHSSAIASTDARNQSEWMPQVEKIILGQTELDGTLAQMWHQQTIQRELDSKSLASFNSNMASDGYSTYLLPACVIILFIIVLFLAIVFCYISRLQTCRIAELEKTLLASCRFGNVLSDVI